MRMRVAATSSWIRKNKKIKIFILFFIRLTWAQTHTPVGGEGGSRRGVRGRRREGFEGVIAGHVLVPLDGQGHVRALDMKTIIFYVRK
jgi:hypothetical protein